MGANIELVLFDFGGVLADEGYKDGLAAIAKAHRLEPAEFNRISDETILACGYLTGRATESHFWDLLRRHTAIGGSDAELRGELLERFRLREWMLAIVAGLRRAGVRLAILSDQTDWLDELEARQHFSANFERVFNSYHTGKSKADASLFSDVLAELQVAPTRALFIDDNAGHIGRACAQGLHVIHYTGRPAFVSALAEYFPRLIPGD